MILYTVVTAVVILLAGMVICGKYEEINDVDGHLWVRKGYGVTKRQGYNAIGLGAIFLILFGLSAFRLGVGNDYGSYVDTCHEIFVGGYVVTEPGFNLVVRALYHFMGRESYVLMFAFFAFFTTIIFLKAIYEQSNWFQMGIFLFMTLGLYFRTFNTVRYYFVLAITLFVIKYVTTKQYVKFVGVILVAALFHKSVLVVIPLYLVANYKWKKYHMVALAVGATIVTIFQDTVMEIALFLYPSYQDTVYLEQVGGLLGSLNNVARCVCVILLALTCYKEAVVDDEINQFHLKLNILAVVLYVSCSFLPLVSRIGYYLVTSQIVFVPRILMAIQSKKKKRWATAAVVFIGILYFIMFLRTAANDGIRVLPYQSWLFYEEEWRVGNSIF